MKNKPKIIIISGYGLNCEDETKFVFDLAGGSADIVHINDLISNQKILKRYQILAIPGGFSYGDDTGSGNAFARRIKNQLWEEIKSFIQHDHLVIGICNGCQILVNLGLIPGFSGVYGKQEVAIIPNDTVRYIDRWTDLKIENDSPWLKDIKNLPLPIAHGEGKFYLNSNVLKKLKDNNMIALRYVAGDMYDYNHLQINPSGTMDNIAALTDQTKRILGIMPHPERAIFFEQLPNWPWLKEFFSRNKIAIPKFGPGYKIFKNAVLYFS
jgi:phosphoribosylformylglycinamidine synthase subunit PurQ / glutaminase